MSDPNEIPTNTINIQTDANAGIPQETASPAPSEASAQSLSAAEIEELKNRAARADENWDRFLRLTAEFDNYKKRAARERQDAIKYANVDLIDKLISVLDHFDMALLAANATQNTSLDSFKTGITLIRNQLKGVLAEAGVEEVDATSQVFDPRLHEAVSTQESKDVPEGQVLQQLRMGYKLKDRLLRPATVIVSK